MAKVHPPFRVVVGVTHHFKHTAYPEGYEPELREGEIVVQQASGKAVRALVPTDEPYMIDFGEGVIDDILRERAAAKALEAEHIANGTAYSPMEKLSFNQLVAKHIIDSKAMTMIHSTMDHWDWLEVHTAKDFDAKVKELYGQKVSLEAFLQSYFDLEGAPDGVDEEHKGDAK